MLARSLIALLLFPGCATSHDDGVDEEYRVACEDLSEAYVDRAVTCGGSADSARTILEMNGWDCGLPAVHVRDVDVFERECLPALETWDCVWIERFAIPRACEQFEHAVEEPRL